MFNKPQLNLLSLHYCQVSLVTFAAIPQLPKTASVMYTSAEIDHSTSRVLALCNPIYDLPVVLTNAV